MTKRIEHEEKRKNVGATEGLLLFCEQVNKRVRSPCWALYYPFLASRLSLASTRLYTISFLINLKEPSFPHFPNHIVIEVLLMLFGNQIGCRASFNVFAAVGVF